MNLYRRLLEFVKPYWKHLAGAMVCMVFVSGATAGTAFLVKPVLDDIFFKKDLTMLKLLPLGIIGIFLLKGFFDYGQAFLMSYVGQRIIADLREKIYHHIQSLSLSFFTRNPTGVLMSRILNDVNMVQGAVTDAVTGLLKDVFTLIGLVGVIFYRDWRLALIAMVVFPVAVLPIAATALAASRPWPTFPPSSWRPLPGRGSSRLSTWRTMSGIASPKKTGASSGF
jgi:subfamily B ATP-binding cassette protein MsbA